MVLVIPASSKTGRTEEPATSPRPGAGISETTDAQYFVDTSCGMEKSEVRLTVMRFFFALRVALSIARVVSPALPRPTPTLPFLLPMIIATEKENLRPPATTRATRRIVIIFWSNSLRARGARLLERG